MRTLFLIVAFFCFDSQARSQTLFFCTGGDIWRLNLDDCSYKFVIHVNGVLGLYDIAFDSKGNLYATDGWYLWKVNTVDGSVTKLTGFNTSPLNSLTISTEDIAYLVGTIGELMSYDLITGDTMYLGNTGYSSAGDLTFYKGELYLAATNDQLVNVNIEHPELSELVFEYLSN